MSKKLFDLCRVLQWLIPALITFLGALDSAFSWGIIGTVETVASGLVALIGVILQHDSNQFFKDKDIVQKGGE